MILQKKKNMISPENTLRRSMQVDTLAEALAIP